MVATTGCLQKKGLLPLPQSLELVLTSQANLEICPGPSFAQFLATFLGQGHVPTEPSFPRGQAHRQPPISPPYSTWRPLPGQIPVPTLVDRQELLEIFQVAIPSENTPEFHFSPSNPEEGT